MAHASKVLGSVVEAIGGTPVVELSRSTAGFEGRILAKLEYLNPGLSKKDRIARQIIEDAEADGSLAPGAGHVSGADLDLVDRRAAELTVERRAFRADQFRSAGNMRAHLLHTGPEFLAQAQDGIDAFCEFVGSAGTFAGCAAAFKAHDPSIRCYVVEPVGAAVLAGG